MTFYQLKEKVGTLMQFLAKTIKSEKMFLRSVSDPFFGTPQITYGAYGY